MSAPSFSRKTAKGVPQYRDDEESDTYLHAGEELVPSVGVDGKLIEHPRVDDNATQYRVYTYRPRIEGLFNRIERWVRTSSGETHWRTVSKDNVTSSFGRSSTARIADPRDQTRVFEWLLEETRDDKGSIIAYTYKEEDLAHVDPRLVSESHRLSGRSPITNRYIKRIQYGNQTPGLAKDWHFELVFDYGEHVADPPTPDDRAAPWPVRDDPFSTYRAGFEIRTYRLCRRVLMFHSFAELGPGATLVRATEFEYAPNPVATYLTAVAQWGYVAGQPPARFPKLRLQYSPAVVGDHLGIVAPTELENLPVGLAESRSRWVDLNAEGIAGVLTEQGDGWFYKRNLGEARFAPATVVTPQPSLGNLTSGQQLMDLTGGGELSLVQLSLAPAGFYTRDDEGGWDPFIPFQSLPNIPWDDPNLRFIDLDGDGLNDILITEDDVFRWYPSRGTTGFGGAALVDRPQDEDRGPALVFSDATQSIYLADMSGDGLTDLVRIRSGEVVYWPNLGYGRFGPKVIMDDAPAFEQSDLFDQRRVRLADVDGSGTTDIIYLGVDGARYWANQAGNRWSAPQRLTAFPAIDDLTSVSAIDLFGRGTTCLVWSSPLSADGPAVLRYVDLMGGVKPHLLTSVSNGTGMESDIEYTSSTKFYLDDLAAGQPWVTKLPFPLQVVARVVTRDLVSGGQLVTRYAYHHGYFDGVEREFRGFGRVDQWDAESLPGGRGAALAPLGPPPDPVLHLPPVRTTTWFHTGVYVGRDSVSTHMAHEYYQQDPQGWLLPDTMLPAGIDAQAEREACRALKGQVLRQEVFAEDRSSAEQHPYTVSERNYEVSMLQRPASGRYGVFFAHPREAIDCHYERHPADPRITHQFTLVVDPFGFVRESAAVAYGRRVVLPHIDEQTKTLVTYTVSRPENRDTEADWYRVGVPIETSTYEVTGLTTKGGKFFDIDGLRAILPGAVEIAYEVVPDGANPQKRLIERVRTRYYKNDLTAALPLGAIESLALPYGTYRMAFTPALITLRLGNKVDDATLADKAHYIAEDGAWWIPSGRQVFDPASFYLPVAFVDPFTQTYMIKYDGYVLLVERTADPLQNTVIAGNNYRVMLPEAITDPNGARSTVRFDPFGLVVATVLEGKGEGDTDAFPTTTADYHLLEWEQNNRPTFVHTAAREQVGIQNSPLHHAYTYSDGFGREVLKKVQAEPGVAWGRDENGTLVQVDTSPAVRWVGTGRTVYDHKGNPVKKYEPYFSITSDYEDEPALVKSGVTPILYHDPLGRLVRTELPNGTFSRVEFSAWSQTTYDENDNVAASRWQADRVAVGVSPFPTAAEVRAAKLTAAHDGTPTVAHLDPLGRVFLTIADNGVGGLHPARLGLDIEGYELSVTDALGDPLGDDLKYQVLTQDFDMVGRVLHAVSVDAGESWTLPDVGNKPLCSWDQRGYAIQRVFDELQRPSRVFVTPPGGAKVLAELLAYGEADSPPSVPYALSRLVLHCDGAGRLHHAAYDFKGNLVEQSRRVGKAILDATDWRPLDKLQKVSDLLGASDVLLEGDTFSVTTAYDGLNRPARITVPDGSVVDYGYNKAGSLERVDTTLPGGAVGPAVANVDYNAKGQRELIVYGNQVQTVYKYDQYTFRLSRLSTTHGPDLLQDLTYTYDPVGNIMEIDDAAQETLFFKNQMVTATAHYEYDPVYRLTKADGREHLGQNPVQPTDADLPLTTAVPDPRDTAAMGTYVETYGYDRAGNILTLDHRVGATGWNRDYRYAYQLGGQGNRLRETSAQGDPAGVYSQKYVHDDSGNMVFMPHLPTMSWNHRNELIRADRLGSDVPPIFFTYDGTGGRVRKLVGTAAGVKGEERIYLGGFEVYRKYNGGGAPSLERTTLHVMDDRRRIAMVEIRTVADGRAVQGMPLTRFQLANHLGSAAVEVDGSGKVISYEEYHPYGGTSYHSTDAKVSTKRYRYTAKERDEETGLSYHRARYYVTWLGRWASTDPAGVADQPNAFAYCWLDPISASDGNGWAPNRPTEPGDRPEVVAAISGFRKGKGLVMGGSRELKQEWAAWLTDASRDSKVFGDLLVQIANEKDPLNWISVDLVEEDPEVVGDALLTGKVDMFDLRRIPDAQGISHPNDVSRTELIAHILEERRQFALGFWSTLGESYLDRGNLAHDAAINGVENKIRTERGKFEIRAQERGDHEMVFDRTTLLGTLRVVFKNGTAQDLPIVGGDFYDPRRQFSADDTMRLPRLPKPPLESIAAEPLRVLPLPGQARLPKLKTYVPTGPLKR